MRYLPRPVARQCQKGSVAVEAAVTIAFILIPLLAFVLLFGKYFWYYTVAQKAAHDAALSLAAATHPDLRNNSARNLATETLIESALQDIDDDSLSMKGTETYCLYRMVPVPGGETPPLTPSACNQATPPVAVKISISFTVSDPFLAPLTRAIVGYEGLPILAEATMPYARR